MFRLQRLSGLRLPQPRQWLLHLPLQLGVLSAEGGRCKASSRQSRFRLRAETGINHKLSAPWLPALLFLIFTEAGSISQRSKLPLVLWRARP